MNIEGDVAQNHQKSSGTLQKIIKINYLLEVVRYIHLNPLRRSIVKDLAGLDRYRWSGHGVLVGRSRNDWQETGYVLRLLGSGGRKGARAYRRFMEDGKDIGRRPELVGGGLIRSLGGGSKVISLRTRGEREEYDSRVLGRGNSWRRFGEMRMRN